MLKENTLSDSMNTEETFNLLRDKVSPSKGHFYVRIDRYTIKEYRDLSERVLFYPSDFALKEINSLMEQKGALTPAQRWLVNSYERLKEHGDGGIRGTTFQKAKIKKRKKLLSVSTQKPKRQLKVKAIEDAEKNTKTNKRRTLKTKKVSKKKTIKAKSNTLRRTLLSK